MQSFYKSGSEKTDGVIPVYVCRPDDVADLFDDLPERQAAFAKARGFTGRAGQITKIVTETGETEMVLFGAGAVEEDYDGPVRTGNLSQKLLSGTYKFAQLPADWDPALAAIGWGLGAYKFDKYLKDQKVFPSLDISDLPNNDEINALVEASHLGRDLINTPANDMGPEAMETEARAVAGRFGADISVIAGEELLSENCPMIHAVGRAAHEVPRLIEIEWGDAKHPRLALIGKGITFDTGGVNIKSASSARLMKKDMGGAAHALALGQMIMANNLPYRLHILLAVAENSVSAGAFRPGDILSSRAGKSVEIDNTDAEGRLVLGDALTKASESNPKLMIDFATLTGAARVALGPKLPPFFCNEIEYVRPVIERTHAVYDPVWHMPLWQPYFSMLKSPIADMKNAGGGFAGSITAALFLQQFIGDAPWMHFDVYGWNPSSGPGHPGGGEVFGLRGLYQWLKDDGLNS